MRIAIKNFTGGEISETLLARYDLAKYQNSMLHMENFFPNVHSNAVRRSGMRYVATIGEKAVLMPFIFSTEENQNFAILFTEKKIHVYTDKERIATNISSPYRIQDVYNLSYSQVGDVIYIAHKNYALHKLMRSGAYPYIWKIEEVNINQSVLAPNAPTCVWGESGGGTKPPKNYQLRYKIVAVDNKGVQSIGSAIGEVTGRYPTEWVVGDYVDITWSAVTGAEEYNIYRESAGYYGYIGTVKNNDVFSGTLESITYNEKVLPINKFIGTRTRTINSSGNTVTDITVSNGNNNAFYDSATQTLFIYVKETINRYTKKYDNKTHSYKEELSSTTYEYYWAIIYDVPSKIIGTYTNFMLGKKEKNAVSEYPHQQIGSILVSPNYVEGGLLSFRDNNYEPDISDTPQEDWFPFADNNNPSIVAFHQQRMVLAGTKNTPQAIYMSRTGDFENFRKSRPLQDDDPIEYNLASSSIDEIQWVASFKDLLIGTSGAEYKATGAEGSESPITAKGISITPQSFWGSSYLFPIVVGTSILHAERFSAKVRDLFYSLETDGYNGSDLTMLVPHLFDGYKIIQWAYQQSPDCILWCVRNDGVLLAMSYIKEQQIVAWSQHKTDGKVRSICRVSGETDTLFLVVERKINNKISFVLEVLENKFSQADSIENAFFVDSGIVLTSETPKQEWEYPAHLLGKEPVLLVDGSPLEKFERISTTQFKIPYPAKKIIIGLPYRSVLAPLPFNADLDVGSTLGLKRAYGECSIKMYRSVNGKYGTQLDNLFDFPFLPNKYGEAVKPFSGDLFFIPQSGQDENTTLYIVQDDPLPMQIMGLVVNIDFGQMG